MQSMQSESTQIVYETPNKFSYHKWFLPENDQRMQQICPGFQGLCWRLATDWKDIFTGLENQAIEYLEIGTLHGANLISFWKTFGQHPDTRFTIIDPYQDYAEYHEYQGEQSTNLKTFIHNLEISDFPLAQLKAYREFSYSMIPSLTNEFYTFIYIDGNHLPSAVLEDAVLAWRKLKHRGCMVFDDYGWGGPDCTQRGIDAFVIAYRDEIEQHFASNGQYFVKKK